MLDTRTPLSSTIDAPDTTTQPWPSYGEYKDSGVAWLGNIPAHWNVKRLKFITRFAYGDSLAADDREPGDVPVYGSNGVVGTHSQANTTGPCLIIGRKGSFGKVTYSDEQCFAIDTTYFVDRTTTKHDIRWLYSALSCLDLDSVSQDTGVPGLSRDAAYAQWLAHGSVAEQRAIAAFLDRETAEIDDLISKKERLITLLEEKRAALISHAVTKGLDPTAPMKDSGVAWLGNIPAHWDVLDLRRVVRKFVDYRGATPTKVPSGVPLITARNIKNGGINFSLSEEFISEEEYATRMVRGYPSVGDVVVTTEAPLGEAAQIVDEAIALAQRIILLKTDTSLMRNDYLKQYLRSQAGQGELWSRATGSTAIGIKASHLKEISVVIPPIQEQDAIIAYLDQETAKIDALIAKVRQHIGKLRERRTAVISAAVTGKIDVRVAVHAQM